MHVLSASPFELSRSRGRGYTVPGRLALAVALLGLILVAGCEREADVAAPAADPAPAADTRTPPPAEPGVTMDEATRVKAETLIDQVIKHIEKRELDAAETGLRELERMSASLPEATKKQIETAKASLTAARATPTPPATPPQR